MKQSTTQKYSLGLFIVISTIVLVIALYFIGNRQNLFGHTFKISAVFNNVNGLELGNNVRYSGINVGTVKNITMINDTSICVDMIIEEKMLKHIKKNAIAAIGSDGLVGSMIINIVPNKNLSNSLVNGDTIKSYSKISTTDMLTTLNTTNDNAAVLTSDLLKITTSIREGEGTLGMLINDPNVALDLKETIANLKIASSNASATITDIKNSLSTVNYNESVAAVLLNDSISADKLKSIINNFSTSSANMNTLINNLNTVIITVKDSKGALNYMVKDTLLVKHIDTTVNNLKESSKKLNEDLEALKHNFLLKGYFKKLERKKNKEKKEASKE